MLAVHGLLRNSADFNALANALAADYHVIAVDVRGRGHSSWGPVDEYAVPHYAEDMLQLLDILKIPKVHWLGTSMGGMIGLALASTHPERFASLTFNDIGPVLNKEGMRRINKYVQLYPSFADKTAATEFISRVYKPFNLSQDETAELAAHSFRHDPADNKLYLHYDPAIAKAYGDYADALEEDTELWHLYDNLTMPILVIRGADSDILDRDTFIAMTARAKGFVMGYTEPDVGHAPMLHKPATIEIIRQFLNTASAEAATPAAAAAN